MHSDKYIPDVLVSQASKQGSSGWIALASSMRWRTSRRAAQQADAEGEGEDGGGRRRARDVRRDARQAEREVQANRMRKKDVSSVNLPLRFCLVGTSCSLQQGRPVMP